MMRLLIIPLAAAIVPMLIPAVRDWIAEKVSIWRSRMRRKREQ